MAVATSHAVIVCGVLWLTAAFRLTQRGHGVTVLEISDIACELVSGLAVARGIWLKRFYPHTFRSGVAWSP